jgi:hypothetical protein
MLRFRAEALQKKFHVVGQRIRKKELEYKLEENG